MLALIAIEVSVIYQHLARRLTSAGSELTTPDLLSPQVHNDPVHALETFAVRDVMGVRCEPDASTRRDATDVVVQLASETVDGPAMHQQNLHGKANPHHPMPAYDEGRSERELTISVGGKYSPTRDLAQTTDLTAGIAGVLTIADVMNWKSCMIEYGSEIMASLRQLASDASIVTIFSDIRNCCPDYQRASAIPDSCSSSWTRAHLVVRQFKQYTRSSAKSVGTAEYTFPQYGRTGRESMISG